MTSKFKRQVTVFSLMGLAIMAITIVFGANVYRGNAQEGSSMQARTITVTGSGTTNGAPDTVYIGLGVDRVDSNIDSAVNGARETLRAIVAAVRETGVDDRDIQTAYYNVFPEDRYDNAGQPTGDRQFRVSLGINVTVRNVDNATPVISAALNAGATSVQNLNFGIADARPLESQARIAAVADARARAEELAAAFGVTLGDVISVSEGFGGGVIPIADGRMNSAAGGNNQIVPGQLSVTTNVQVIFAIEG